eukprot:TRINITY_DN199_c0_g1_i1.p2 TRINITY_DN199_c0_g1~~TRINITY_DN199_c0_g1_i1.p2  ORF type:complete len:334 (+),score=107.50 TRINITY_DN199_c0_g1_i1:78-1004(+)
MSKRRDPLINMAGGATSGMVAVTASYPFDLLKTRLHFELQKGKRATMLDTTKIIAREGYQTGFMGIRSAGAVLGFYRGLDQLLPEAAFKVLLRFLVFKETENYYRRFVMGDETGKAILPMPAQMVCGAAAGFIETAIVVQPFERGKTLRADFHSPYKVWGDKFRTQGFGAGMRSIYTGFGACAGRQVGNQAISFPVFYKVKELRLQSTGRQDLNNFERLGFGFFAGSCSSLVTMPLDVAKTIAQKQQGEVTQGTLQIITDVYRKTGIRSLYTGLAPRIGRVGLDRGVGFLAYEYIVELLESLKGKGDK